MFWELDDDPDTATFAAVEDGSGAIVGVATVHPQRAPFDPAASSPEGPAKRSWRLRGMATREGLRGKGIGSLVIEAVIAHVADMGGEIVWCNARAKAVGFYERAGFETRGEEWEIPFIGRHVVMWRKVGTEKAP